MFISFLESKFKLSLVISNTEKGFLMIISGIEETNLSNFTWTISIVDNYFSWNKTFLRDHTPEHLESGFIEHMTL